MGESVAPAADECGEGTLNPDCEQVCDGEITTTSGDRLGATGDEELRALVLGASVRFTTGFTGARVD